MNMTHRHIAGIALFLCALPGLLSCSSDSNGLTRNGSDGRDLFLTFLTAEAGGSAPTDEDNDANVGTLRIVIVSQEKGTEAVWTVEHNSRVSLTAPLPQMYSFKVEADRKKRIYLIANEDGLVDAGGSALDFNDNTKFIPQDGNGKAAVDDYVFVISEEHPYTPNALPMTAMYEIEVPAVNEVANSEYPLPDPLHLVRAATKFTFEFTNQSIERDITVTGIDVSQVVTDKMYLMPHVNTKNGKYWVVKETKAESGSTYAEKVLQDMDWGKWMDGEIERSKRKEDNEWLTDYEIPDGTDPQTVKFTDLKADEMPKSEAGTENYSSVKIPGAFYLPESRTVKAGDNQYKLQEYSITIHTTENGEEKDYTVTLPHLASLFRNTHIVVGATFTDKEYPIDWRVDVIPFTSVELSPDMGLEREEFTGYIIGKDNQGRKCWYDASENPNNPEERTPYYLGPNDAIGNFVEINDTSYLLVYTDFERTARSLDHIFEKDTEKNTLIKHLLAPEKRTGYEKKNGIVDGKTVEWYQTPLKLRVWLDEGGDPEGSDADKEIYDTLKPLNLWGCRILYEWDRWEWEEALRGDEKYRPKYWFDVLGNRYPFSIGDYPQDREKIIGEWVKYLKDTVPVTHPGF